MAGGYVRPAGRQAPPAPVGAGGIADAARGRNSRRAGVSGISRQALAGLAGLFAVSGAGAPWTGPAAAGPVEDALAYCRSVGDNNMINAVPPDMLEQTAKKLGVTLPANEPARAVWRCMDGAVMVCIAGGRRFCGRADTQVVPSPEARTYCHDNPSAVEVPSWATGRDTIFAWRCEGPEPIVSGAVRSVDKRGFVKEYWQAYKPDAQ